MRRAAFVAAFIVSGSALIGATETSRIPSIVELGRPQVRACAECHSVNGFGRPDTSNLAGLPAEYIAHQIADFQRGFRRSGDSRIDAMNAVAVAIDDREVAAASQYFASIKPRRSVRVVEVSSSSEAIAEVFDAGRRGYVASVPTGSLKRGESLVEGGGAGRTVRCANCHSVDLRGTVSIPGIAGRFPAYIARQLTDMRNGVRHGVGSDRMMATVARLTTDDIVAIASYLASLEP